MTWQKRIKLFIKHLGVSQNGFGDSVGMSSTKITNIVKHESDSQVSNVVAILSEYKELSAEWLLRGEGKMLKEQSATDALATDQEQLRLQRLLLESQARQIEFLQDELREARKREKALTEKRESSKVSSDYS